MLFILPKPSGHGLYKIEFTLPEIGEEEKEITIEIENGMAIFFPNVNLEAEDTRKSLKLHATTNERYIRFYCITELGYVLLSDFIAAGLFAIVITTYLFVRRRDVKRAIRVNLKCFPKPIKMESYESGYVLRFKLPLQVERQNKEYLAFKVIVPNWLISSFILVFFVILFVYSIIKPLEGYWKLIGNFRYAIFGFGVILGALSAILLISSPNKKSFIKRISLLGGGLIGVMFSYLGWLALVLFVVSSLLIYYLSMLILEDEEHGC